VFSAKQFDATWLMPWEDPVNVERHADGYTVRLPESLKVRSAYVAHEEGMTELEQKGETWTSTSAELDWYSLAYRVVNLTSGAHYFGMYDDKETVGLPLRKDLEDYFIWSSFPYIPESEEAQDSYTFEGLRHRTYRERRLGIRERFRDGGAVLLLLLESAEGLCSVSIRGHRPAQVEVCLVRVMIPPV
jgi:hypothetical protein